MIRTRNYLYKGVAITECRVPLADGGMIELKVASPNNRISGLDNVNLSKHMAIGLIGELVDFAKDFIPLPARLAITALQKASELSSNANDGDKGALEEIEHLKDKGEDNLKRALQFFIPG